MKDILALTHRLRDSTDSSLTSIATSLSTRQLLRIAKRLKQYPEEDAYHAIHKACLARYFKVDIWRQFHHELIGMLIGM